MLPDLIGNRGIRGFVVATLFIVGIGTIVRVQASEAFLRKRKFALNKRTVEAGLHFHCSADRLYSI
jgi:hypothetical protein